LHGTNLITSNGIDVWISNSRGTTLAEVSATTGSFVKDVKVSSLGLQKVDTLSSDSTHLWAVDSTANAVAEVSAGSGSLVKVLKGAAYRFDGPLAITTDGTHVWVANERSNSITEVNAKTGTFVRFIHGKSFALDVVTAIASNGSEIWATSIGIPLSSGNAVTEINASPLSAGGPVAVFRGAKYGFDYPNAITYIGGRVWVANGGSNTLTELWFGRQITNR